MPSVTEVLDTVDTVMSQLNAIAQLPGVNMIPYVSTLSGVISTVHAVYNAGKDVTPFLVEIKRTFEGEAPSEADVEALRAKIAELEARIDEPLPPAEPGEPE